MPDRVPPTRIGTDNSDLEDELTELEYEASQHPLSQAESQHLQELRSQHVEIARDVVGRVEPPQPGNPVVSGDDSP